MLGQAKVAELDVPILVQDNVVGLEVPMHVLHREGDGTGGGKGGTERGRKEGVRAADRLGLRAKDHGRADKSGGSMAGLGGIPPSPTLNPSANSPMPTGSVTCILWML